MFDLIKSYYGNAGTEDWAIGDTVLLPDLQGRVIAGKDDMSGTSADRLTDQTGGVNGDSLGDTGGSETHLLTAAESGVAAHEHTQGLRGPNVSGSVESQSGGTSGGAYSNTGGVAGGAQDASSAHNNVQPTIILNYIIKF